MHLLWWSGARFWYTKKVEQIVWSPANFVTVFNQTLEAAYPEVNIEGEVANFKVNQGKFVFFDLKDDEASLGCFMMLFQLRQPLEDGMKVVVQARPKLTERGKFSLTVQNIQLVGEGTIKLAAEKLRQKLDREGLFDLARKRPLPTIPTRIGLISSEQAAGYADFIRILDERWAGMKIYFKHTAVQGKSAPDEIIKALEELNQLPEPLEVVAIIRGGGSAEELAVFNDELLVRAVATSRTPVLIGVGHEIDQNLCDLAADFSAATPTHAAQILTSDKTTVVDSYHQRLKGLRQSIGEYINFEIENLKSKLNSISQIWQQRVEGVFNELQNRRTLLQSYNPLSILRRGYALVHGEIKVGRRLQVETAKQLIDTEVKNVTTKQKTANY